MAERSSGIGRSKKRMLAAERHRESITGQIGLWLTRKSADVDRVTHPKNDARIEVNQWKRSVRPPQRWGATA